MRKTWTKEEEAFLLSQLNKYKSARDLPTTALSEKMGRTSDSILRKAKRLQDDLKSQYEWEKEESDEAFLLYLNGEALGSILAKLHQTGSQFDLDQLEQELKARRKRAEDVIKDYAEERKLKVSSRLTLDTILLFRKNYNTTNDFERKALHSRIARG